MRHAAFLLVAFALSVHPARAEEPTLAVAVARCFEPGFACADLVPAGTRRADTAAAAEIRDGDDPKFQAVVGAFITAAGADIAVSMYQIGRGAARERGFGATWQDSPVAFAVTKSGLTAVFVYSLQRLHRTRPKTAFILGLAGTAVESALVARGAGIQHPNVR